MFNPTPEDDIVVLGQEEIRLAEAEYQNSLRPEDRTLRNQSVFIYYLTLMTYWYDNTHKTPPDWLVLKRNNLHPKTRQIFENIRKKHLPIEEYRTAVWHGVAKMICHILFPFSIFQVTIPFISPVTVPNNISTARLRNILYDYQRNTLNNEVLTDFCPDKYVYFYIPPNIAKHILKNNPYAAVEESIIILYKALYEWECCIRYMVHGIGHWPTDREFTYLITPIDNDLFIDFPKTCSLYQIKIPFDAYYPGFIKGIDKRIRTMLSESYVGETIDFNFEFEGENIHTSEYELLEQHESTGTELTTCSSTLPYNNEESLLPPLPPRCEFPMISPSTGHRSM